MATSGLTILIEAEGFRLYKRRNNYYVSQIVDNIMERVQIGKDTAHLLYIQDGEEFKKCCGEIIANAKQTGSNAYYSTRRVA